MFPQNRGEGGYLKENEIYGAKDGLGNQGVSAHFSCSFLATNGLVMIKYRSFLKTLQ